MPDELKTVQAVQYGEKTNLFVTQLNKALDIGPEDPNDFFSSNAHREDKADKVREMDETCPPLYGMGQTISDAILKLKWGITGTGQEADFTRDVFGDLPNFHDFMNAAVMSIKAGNGFFEQIFFPKNGKNWLNEIKERPLDRFDFTADSKIKVYDECGHDFKVYPKYKFITCAFNRRESNPWGLGLYHHAYWSWFFWVNTQKFYSIWTERFIDPIPVISADKGSTLSPEDVQVADDFIKNLRNSSGIVLSNPAVLKLIQAVRAAGNDYDKFLQRLENDMSLIMHGQNQAVDTGSEGSRARDVERSKIRTDRILRYVDMVESFINTEVIRQLIDLNFIGVKEYPRFSMNVFGGMDVTLFTFVNSLVSLAKSGVKVPVPWVKEKLGIPESDSDDEFLSAIRGEIRGTATPEEFSEYTETWEEQVKRHILGVAA